MNIIKTTLLTTLAVGMIGVNTVDAMKRNRAGNPREDAALVSQAPTRPLPPEVQVLPAILQSLTAIRRIIIDFLVARPILRIVRPQTTSNQPRTITDKTQENS